MQKLTVRGGTPLRGEVRISGAKNAALPIMCASLLTNDVLQLGNMPDLKDVTTMRKLLEHMGVKTSVRGEEVFLSGAPLDKSEGVLSRVISVMTTPPPWALDLPLAAEGWVGTRFRK